MFKKLMRMLFRIRLKWRIRLKILHYDQVIEQVLALRGPHTYWIVTPLFKKRDRLKLVLQKV